MINAYTLYEQGYRAEDVTEIMETYKLTEVEADDLYDLLRDIEYNTYRSLYDSWI